MTRCPVHEARAMRQSSGPLDTDWIGDADGRITDAVFVPPPPETLDDLRSTLHCWNAELPPGRTATR
jgi:hypothetical protein